MHSVTRTIFPVFAFKVTHRVTLLTRFCKLLTRVATPCGGTCLEFLNGTTPLLMGNIGGEKVTSPFIKKHIGTFSLWGISQNSCVGISNVLGNSHNTRISQSFFAEQLHTYHIFSAVLLCSASQNTV